MSNTAPLKRLRPRGARTTCVDMLFAVGNSEGTNNLGRFSSQSPHSVVGLSGEWDVIDEIPFSRRNPKGFDVSVFTNSPTSMYIKAFLDGQALAKGAESGVRRFVAEMRKYQGTIPPQEAAEFCDLFNRFINAVLIRVVTPHVSVQVRFSNGYCLNLVSERITRMHVDCRIGVPTEAIVTLRRPNQPVETQKIDLKRQVSINALTTADGWQRITVSDKKDAPLIYIDVQWCGPRKVAKENGTDPKTHRLTDPRAARNDKSDEKTDSDRVSSCEDGPSPKRPPKAPSKNGRPYKKQSKDVVTRGGLRLKRGINKNNINQILGADY